ncbi:MAG TPA: S8 family serine peptidase [Thermomicrobiales bacterium]|nr:S8 family serine peptidase [Thermomicrobiales bacterium]
MVVSAIVAISSLPIGSVAPMLSVTAQEEAPASGEEVIVVLEDDADPIVAAQELGVEPTHIYDGVFTGFAATMPAAAVAEARASDAVRQISRDGRVQAEDQIVGTGVLRVGVLHTPGSQNLAITSPIDADVAILDTGVDRGGDLRVSGGASCVNDKHKKKGKGKNQHKGHKHKHKKKDDKSKSWADDNGHGTHVASIAAALDNDQGIVGVAPGARVWAVKVLDENGGGSFSDVICGLNWVVNHSGTVDVVNLSLSGAGSDGPCESSPLHQAICNVVYSGVPVVVAAGNQGTDASTRVPASFDEVITVSGMADSDGAPGHAGPGTCTGQADDTFLPFSNYGADVDVAAPGDCILSLGKDGKRRQESGTSSASPHVAGAVADFIQSFTYGNGFRPSPDQVRTWLLTQASKPQNSEFGFSGDPDGVPEPMLWLREGLGG